MCSGSPPGEGPEAIVEESSFAGGEVFSALVEEDESTFALLDEGGATLGDLDELKYPPPPGLENTEYALRAPAAGRSRCARTDIAVDEQRASWWCSALLSASLAPATPSSPRGADAHLAIERFLRRLRVNGDYQTPNAQITKSNGIHRTLNTRSPEIQVS